MAFTHSYGSALPRDPRRRRKYLALAALVVMLAAAVLLGCRTQQSLVADYDREADFSRFRSFKFVTVPATYRLGYPSSVTRQIAAAIQEEMVKRGYRFEPERADLLVNFSGTLAGKAGGAPPDDYYAYRSYSAWPAYRNGEHGAVEYAPGTLNVDLIDAAGMHLVWEGVAIGGVTAQEPTEQRQQITAAIGHLFAKFPFRAGQAQPAHQAASVTKSG